VLATFDETNGGLRFVVLVNRLELSRDSLRASLASLKQLDLVMKNPGYGHPLRPEYILTDRGKAVASVCADYMQEACDINVLLRKWSAPILLALLHGHQRFNEIRAALEVTPRALTQALKLLEGLVNRSVEDEYPPVTRYSLTDNGESVARTVEQLRNLLADS
jgi:DNA-binding HxlR family transcriptional regulator